MNTKKLLIYLFFLTIYISCQESIPTKTESTVLLETIKSWNGNVLPKFPEGQPKITISKVVIPPKTKLPKHIHPVLTTGVLTKGELTVTDNNNNQITIKAGDVLVEVVNTIHFGENKGSEAAEIIVFYIGEENTPTTILTKK